MIIGCRDKQTENVSEIEYSYIGKINLENNVGIKGIFMDNLFVGKLQYWNEVVKPNERIIGIKQSDSNYHLRSFDTNGNIKWNLMAKFSSENLKGEWYDFQNNIWHEFTLTKKVNNTLKLESLKINYEENDLSGEYRFDYGIYQGNGSLILNRIDKNRYEFELIALGDGEGPSIAQIEKDTIQLLHNEFNYKVRETDNCVLNFKIYNRFIVAKYVLSEDCHLQFGQGAYVDGIYYRQ